MSRDAAVRVRAPASSTRAPAAPWARGRVDVLLIRPGQYSTHRALGGMRGSIGSMSEPTQKYSITMPRDIAEAARARSGPSGLSAYVAAAVARQIERDNLNELIAVAEAEHGPVSEEEIQDKRDQLQRAREQQRTGAASSA